MEEKPVTQPLKFGPTFRFIFLYIRFHDTRCPRAFNKTSALDGGQWSASLFDRFTLEKTPVPIGQEA
jgi:hypothetical protein